MADWGAGLTSMAGAIDRYTQQRMQVAALAREQTDERQGLEITADLLRRWYGEDPEFAETYGDQLAKAPGMSNSQLRGLVGSMGGWMGLKAKREQEAVAKRELARMDWEAGQRSAGQRFTSELARYQPRSAMPQVLAPEVLDRYGLAEGQGVSAPQVLAAAQQAGYAMPPKDVLDLLQTRDTWGLRPADVVAGPNGMVGMPTSRNSVQWMPPAGRVSASDTLATRRAILAHQQALADVTKNWDPKQKAAVQAQVAALYRSIGEEPPELDAADAKTPASEQGKGPIRVKMVKDGYTFEFPAEQVKALEKAGWAVWK